MFNDSCYYVSLAYNGGYSVVVRNMLISDFLAEFEHRRGAFPHIMSITPISEDEFYDLSERYFGTEDTFDGE